MCEQCLVNPYHYGPIIDGPGVAPLYLIRARRESDDMQLKEWGLLWCNDPFMFFMETPHLNHKNTNEVINTLDKFSTQIADTTYVDEYYKLITELTKSVQFKELEKYEYTSADFDVKNACIKYSAWIGKFYYIIAKHIENSTPEVDSQDSCKYLDDTCKFDYTYDPKEI